MNKVLQYLREILYLLGEDRKRLPGLLLLFLSTSMLELVGLGLIFPYINLMVNPEEVSNGTVGQLAKYFVSESSSLELLIFLSGALLTVFAIKTFSTIWINRTIIAFSMQQQVRLCSFLMQAYQQLPYKLYLQRNSSEYIHSIQILTAQFSGKVVTTTLQTLSNGIVGIVILAMLAWSNFQIFLLLFVLLGCMAFSYDRLFRRRIHSFGHLVNQFSTKMVQGIHEGIEGLKEIRILGRETHFHQSVQEAAQKTADIGLKLQVISTAPRYLLEFLMVAFLVLLVCILLILGHDLKALLPTLGMYAVASLRLIPSVNVLTSSFLQLRFCRDGVSRLYRDLIQLKQQKSFSETIVARTPEPFRKLTLKNIIFSYPQSTRPALNKISLQLNSGESLGLIGPSGAGKTTLVDLLLGLLKPQTGEILYNENTLNEVMTEWRSQIAYLPQQVFLIDNTLRHNVALGEADCDIEEPRLREALRQACLNELVEQLPQGVDTMVGERGARLSGGQRQRVALARAFYHKRSILVMDEATSALDTETESVIVSEIKRLKGKKTIIVIAHRLTTVQHCDRIHRLENGQIVDQKTPEQLLLKKEPKL